MNRIIQNIKQTVINIYKVWLQEFYNVFHNAGAMIFFFLLPTGYPIVYSLIYNPEIVREVPAVVVDNSRSALSRQFVRDIDASQKIKVIGYATDMSDAKKAMYQKDCYSIIFIPSDFADKIGRNEQTNVMAYCDMSLLLRYKAILAGINEVGMENGAKIQMDVVNDMNAASYVSSSNASPVQSFAFSMGDTEQGFGSFIIPGIVMLILQQSMVLGICILGAAENERRLNNNGIDPRSVKTGIINTMIGRCFCYFMIYIPCSIYILAFIPNFFMFPQAGNVVDISLFMVPYLLACVFFGMCVQVFVREREDVFPVVVFSSVIFLFISGLTWPRYAMAPIWKLLGDLAPSTWGVEGFIVMNGNSALLNQMTPAYYALWILCISYFILAYIIYRFVDYRKRANPINLAKYIRK